MLQAIFEPDFYSVSYGYRPNVGPQKAVKDLTFELQFGRYGYVVEANIKGFFDHINHDWLLRMIEERVDDKPFLGLIDSWSKAGILERDGSVIHPQTGTPQGGVVSPILANIYLHYAVDHWFERVIKAHCQGQENMIRFADDFVSDTERGHADIEESGACVKVCLTARVTMTEEPGAGKPHAGICAGGIG